MMMSGGGLVRRKRNINLIPGGGDDANLHHPPNFLQYCQCAKMDTLKKFRLLIYTYMAYFSKISCLYVVAFKILAILGWSVARRIKFFCSKSLNTEYAKKSKDLLRFGSNFDRRSIWMVEVC